LVSRIVGAGGFKHDSGWHALRPEAAGNMRDDTNRRAHCGLRVAALAASLVAVPAAAQTDELAANRALWQDAAPDAYRYGYNKYCECHAEMPPETVVEVRDGAVAGVHHVHPDSSREVPARAGSLDYYWTVDDLFALLESAFARNAVVRVRYDSALGYPVQLYVDYDRDLVGDELDVRLTHLDVLDR
jgi:hypothetical protein